MANFPNTYDFTIDKKPFFCLNIFINTLIEVLGRKYEVDLREIEVILVC